MKAGERQWVLSAADASYSANRTSLILTEPRLTMTSDDGKKVSVQAPKAVVVLNGNHVKRATLSGGTVIDYGDFVMTTDVCDFQPDKNSVEAPGAVTVQGEGLKVTGIGMTGNPKTRVFELHSQVNTEITPKPSSVKSKKS
jgi:LPS export ABC transporter protein LptC